MFDGFVIDLKQLTKFRHPRERLLDLSNLKPMKAVKISRVALSSRSTAEPRPAAEIIRSQRRLSSIDGLTIVEVAVAGALLAVTFLGIFGGLFYAYRTAAEVRYRDSARFVIKSLGDQFLVMPAQTTTGGFKTFWSTTTSPTGIGLSWADSDGLPSPHGTGNASGLIVHLGESTGTPIEATVTRDVRYLNASGQVVSSIASSSAGYLLRGDFTITYQLKGKTYSQTLSLVRAWP